MAKDKKKSKKQSNPQLSTKKSKGDKKSKKVKGQCRCAAEDIILAVGPLVTSAAIGSVGELPARLNPISRNLNAIKQFALEAADAKSAPRALQQIGREIRDACPPGYEEYWDPPLSAQQLFIFLMDEEAIAFVRTEGQPIFPFLGPNVTAALNKIARTLTVESVSIQAS